MSELRTVTCHLARASLAAVAGGRSADTTMGFTPLDGLVMATRSGSIDPGLVLWLQRHAGITADGFCHVLEHESGLAGLAGGTGDMREVLAGAAAGTPAAVLALAVDIHRPRRQIAAMTAALGGPHAGFTGGIGEHSHQVRAAATDGLRYLGAASTCTATGPRPSTASLSTSDAPVRTLLGRGAGGPRNRLPHPDRPAVVICDRPCLTGRPFRAGRLTRTAVVRAYGKEVLEDHVGAHRAERNPPARALRAAIRVRREQAGCRLHANNGNRPRGPLPRLDPPPPAAAANADRPRQPRA